MVVGAVGLADENWDVVGGEEATVGGTMAVGDFGGAAVGRDDVEEGFDEGMLDVDVGHGFEEAHVEGDVFGEDLFHIF